MTIHQHWIGENMAGIYASHLAEIDNPTVDNAFRDLFDVVSCCSKQLTGDEWDFIRGDWQDYHRRELVPAVAETISVASDLAIAGNEAVSSSLVNLLVSFRMAEPLPIDESALFNYRRDDAKDAIMDIILEYGENDRPASMQKHLSELFDLVAEGLHPDEIQQIGTMIQVSMQYEGRIIMELISSIHDVECITNPFRYEEIFSFGSDWWLFDRREGDTRADIHDLYHKVYNAARADMEACLEKYNDRLVALPFVVNKAGNRWFLEPDRLPQGVTAHPPRPCRVGLGGLKNA